MRPESLPKFDSIEDQFKYGSVGDRVRSRGSRTGSGRSCRAYSPTSCRARAAMRRSGSSGSRARSCPLASRRSTSTAVPASPSTARSATRRRFGRTSSCAPTHRCRGPGQPDQPSGLREVPPGSCSRTRASTRTSSSTAIAGLTRLSWPQRMQYRYLLIPAMRRARCKKQRREYQLDVQESGVGTRAASILSIRSSSGC